MTRRAKHWRALLREQEWSGLTQAAFCRQRRINSGTFAWWKRKLRADAGTESAGSGAGSRRGPSRTDPLRFMEVAVVGAGRERYEIVLPGGRVVRVPADFDPANVARLIRAVESAC